MLPALAESESVSVSVALTGVHVSSRAGQAGPSAQPDSQCATATGEGESLWATCHAAEWAAVVCELEYRDPLIAILSVNRFPAAAHRMSVFICRFFLLEWNG
ncbi:MAG: hypothetical protein A07HR60_02752 [uncultured archaeon A07HR60]|nr:MAG: hypothetical protein A07HR60_02752 [uncultured archaeon A07HR60]